MLYLAPDRSLRNLGQFWKNLVSILKSSREQLPGKRFSSQAREDSIVGYDGRCTQDEEASELDAIVDNYHKHEKIIKEIIDDKDGVKMPVFYTGAAFKKCLEYAHQRKKELGK